MGRIAEALKKAERERRETMRDTAPRSPVELLEPTSASSVAEPRSESGEPAASAHPVRAPAEGMAESLVTYFDSSSVIAEQYRSLRTRLLSMNPNGDHRAIAITSAVPREGKSVTAMNLAMSLAEIQHLRVLAIDGDFRRSSLSRLLNQPGDPGLADMLRGQATYEDIVQSTPIGNLSFIAAGRTGNRSAAELLSSEAMVLTFRRLQAQYHYVIVDTPPATTVTDVGIIGQLCSAVLVVVRMNRTPGPVVRRAVRMLQVNNIPVAGCIPVGSVERSSRYGYYYGYYPYYRYYKYYRKDDEKQGGGP